MFGTGLGQRTGVSRLVNAVLRRASALNHRLAFGREQMGLVNATPPAVTWPPEHEVNRVRFNKIMAQAAPRKSYVIYFTPRSGSSRVTDILTQTRGMGTPGECFNPVNVPVMAKALGAYNLEEFVDVVLRHKMRGGIHGFDVTYGMIQRVFRSEEAFMAYFRESPCFWLIREDIVLQAVSLYKMETTRLSHSVSSDADARAAAEESFVYDANEIRHWLTHIRKLEAGCEAMFKTFDLTPLRLSYEDMAKLSAPQIVSLFAQHVEVEGLAQVPVETRHSKIATSKNSEFAERFRAENARFMRKVDEERAPMLAAIHRQTPANIG